MTETEPMVPLALLTDVLTQLAELKATTDLILLAVQGLALTHRWTVTDAIGRPITSARG